MADISEGAKVLVKGRDVGVIRYGPATTEFASGEWVGVELETAAGEGNGTVAGVQYFSCPDGHATFVRPPLVEPYDAQAAAANQISRLARSRAAKKVVKQKLDQDTWNALENHQEQLNLRRGAQMKDAQRSLEHEASAKHFSRRESAKDEDDLTAIEPDASYAGATVTLPVTESGMLAMLDHFKHGRNLHISSAARIFGAFHRMVSQLASLEEVLLPADDGQKYQLTVIGDLHGQLQDLFSIFAINGLPSKHNWYLFNGDFVDRGNCGVEVIATIFGFKLLFPGCVHFNRGNHESRNQNSWMGFEEEVFAKYSEEEYVDPAAVEAAGGAAVAGQRLGGGDARGRRMLELCHNIFDALPLATLVEKKIFVVHGGLSARCGITLAHIKSIKRKREPPLHGTSFEDRLIEDLLWSDPRNISGTQPSERGAGVEFGQEITNNFCAVNSVALVIRSHECVMEGFEVQHGGRLITLFSASRYCGTQTNKGAFLTLGKDLQPAIQQFYAHSLEQTDFGTAAKDEEEKSGDMAGSDKLADDVIKMLIERICDHKHSLFWYFTQHDSEHCGRVSRVDWATALRNVLALDLPFISYQSRLAELEEDGSINYAKFLERYRIQMADEHNGWQDSVIDQICQKLYRAIGGGTLREAFAKFDTDGDHFIEYEEFMKTLKTMDCGLTEAQIYELMRSCDTDNDSKIDFEEFAGRFQVVFERVAAKEGAVVAPPLEAFAQEGLSRIGAALYAKFDGKLLAAFEQFDTDGNKEVSLEEFASGVATLEIEPAFSNEELVRLLKAVDIDASGQIDYPEFVSAFRISDSAPSQKGVGGGAGGAGGGDGNTWQMSVLQQVANVLYQHRIHLRSAFRMFDMDNSGTVTADEFQKSLATINQLLDCPLTPHQIAELMTALDTDGDGVLSYKEFFDGFKIVDTRLAELPST
jgi:protein phosphatase